MTTFAKRIDLAAVGVMLFAAAPAARAQFQQAPGLNQNPYGAAAAGTTATGSSSIFSRPLASMSSTAASPVVPSFGGAGYGGYPGFYPPYYGEWYNPQSGNLFGAAAVIGAETQQMQGVQQTYLLREQVRREKLENRRRIFEEWLYEQNNTPTPQDEFERQQRQFLQEGRNDPPIAEIFSGGALNDLLLDIQKLQGRGVQLPDVPIDGSIVKGINFVPKGKGSANTGLIKRLKAKEDLNWPVALRMPGFEKERGLVNSLIRDAINQASTNGQVDVGTLNELNNAVRQLRLGLKAGLQEGLPFTQYNPAANFLNDVDSSLRALQDADAASYVNGKFTARGGSVGELVKDMTVKGLQFGPSTPGDEPAYVALHRALANYDTTGNTLQTSEQPPR